MLGAAGWAPGMRTERVRSATNVVAEESRSRGHGPREGIPDPAGSERNEQFGELATVRSGSAESRDRNYESDPPGSTQLEGWRPEGTSVGQRWRDHGFFAPPAARGHISGPKVARSWLFRATGGPRAHQWAKGGAIMAFSRHRRPEGTWCKSFRCAANVPGVDRGKGRPKCDTHVSVGFHRWRTDRQTRRSHRQL